MGKETKSRLEKLEELSKKNINPYPSKVKRDMSIADASKKQPEEITVVGKIGSIREHGKSTFMDLTDESGKIQIYFKLDVIGGKDYSNLKLLDVGDYLEICGSFFKTKMGELTIEVKSYRIIDKTLLPVPDKWYGLKDVELRYRQRFLDLIMNPASKKNLMIRSKIVTTIREFMDENGFIEIETPILQSIPGGAAAKPFITRYNILDQDMYLRIATELYLKRLVVGGFERVYEIGRIFRNEGLSHMHNPEFTSMEFYWAYQDYESLMKFTEEMLKYVITKVNEKLKIKYQNNEIDLTPPYKKAIFDKLIEKDCGISIFEHPEFEDLLSEVKKKGIELNFKEIRVWAKLVDELYKKVSRPKIIEPTFVIDHPLVLTPLSKAKEDDPNKAQRFQLVVGSGIELVNAYTEQNDPLKQEESLKAQAEMRDKGFEEGEMLDENFIEALKYGLPPTAGWGMGIERLTMILTNQYSIKEVIAFPTLKNKG